MLWMEGHLPPPMCTLLYPSINSRHSRTASIIAPISAGLTGLALMCFSTKA